ncbi:MAG: ADP-ribose pyrophosphatase YjhB (NUDIX family) [Candidatus Nanohaloarchaea archaeon]|jgi:ADP-ribose pyrophosphatase YjhB (NUDIX family)
MLKEVSGSLIVRNQKILLLKNESQEHYRVPMGHGEQGELSADVAERITSEVTGCGCEVERYKKKLKTSFEKEGDEVTMQPYKVTIEGEPQQGEWIDLKDLETIDLHSSISELTEEMAKRL